MQPPQNATKANLFHSLSCFEQQTNRFSITVISLISLKRVREAISYSKEVQRGIHH